MAYPPPTLPTDRTNLMDQRDTHPSDHNTANAAVNDLTGHAVVVDTHVTALYGADNAIRQVNAAQQQDIDNLKSTVYNRPDFHYETGGNWYHTDGEGRVLVAEFRHTFGSVIPFILVTTIGQVPYLLTIDQGSGDNFRVAVFDHNGAPVPNTDVPFYWSAANGWYPSNPQWAATDAAADD